MEKDITTSTDFRSQFEDGFWTLRNVHGNAPLTMQHVLPSFMLLGLGLIPCITVFIIELLSCLKKQ